MDQYLVIFVYFVFVILYVCFVFVIILNIFFGYIILFFLYAFRKAALFSGQQWDSMCSAVMKGINPLGIKNERRAKTLRSELIDYTSAVLAHPSWAHAVYSLGTVSGVYPVRVASFVNRTTIMYFIFNPVSPTKVI